VTTDLLGLQAWLTPKAARKYADIGSTMKGAFAQFARDVREGNFPGKAESFE
jgi:ketopantoate hydroxymethyltransferase